MRVNYFKNNNVKKSVRGQKNMTKEDVEQLKATIEEKIAIINNLFGFQERFTTLEWNILSKFKEYLNKMKQDLENGKIPDHFIGVLQNDVNQNNFIQSFDQFSEPEESNLKSLIDKFKSNLKYNDSYDLYSKLNFAQENIVLIGANGCGKTSLANVLKATMHFDKGIVIPAQKLLVIPTIESIPSYNSTASEYERYQQIVLDGKQTYTQTNSNDIPYDVIRKYGAEYKNILSMLVAEQNKVYNNYCDEKKKGNNPSDKTLHCKMDDVIEIWNYLIEHRKLECESGCNLVLYNKSEKYPAYKMSDGEKAVFYLVARVVLAPPSALIVADEPEMYLHPTIVNKLWDALERKRQDCRFIYLTHNLSFAESRNAVKCWIKSYQAQPSPRWEIEKINFDSGLPEKMQLSLLGSQKKILFCEGKENSLDKKIFERVFENYTIVPVDNCTSVIRYTKAFNKLPKSSVKAYGLIDRDFLPDNALDKLKTDNVFFYDVAEIENLLLIEEFVKAFENYKREPDVFEKIKQDVLEQLRKDVEIQASKYVISHINYIFGSNNGIKGKKASEIKSSFDTFYSQIDVFKMHKERMDEIIRICDANDYSKAIKIYNNKGLGSLVEKNLHLSNFHERALDFIKNEASACAILKKAFPNELFLEEI